MAWMFEAAQPQRNPSETMSRAQIVREAEIDIEFIRRQFAYKRLRILRRWGRNKLELSPCSRIARLRVSFDELCLWALKRAEAKEVHRVLVRMGNDTWEDISRRLGWHGDEE
jgi:hypothetical protein